MYDIIDLHTHSTASDGRMTPEELVKHASKNKIRVIALTDHDSVSGVNEGIEAGCRYNVEVISGIELKAYHKDKELHIIGINIDQNSTYLKKQLNLIRQKRVKRILSILKKLNEIGIHLMLNDVQEIANTQQLQVVHIAEVLTNKGYVKSNSEAFRRYIGKDTCCWDDEGKLSLEEVADIIKKSGGIPFVGHPGYLVRKSSKESIIREFNEYKNLGIEGVEVYFNQNNLRTRALMEVAADTLDLLVSGGSDFHGHKGTKVKIGVGRGNIRMNYRIIAEMKQSRLWKIR